MIRLLRCLLITFSPLALMALPEAPSVVSGNVELVKSQSDTLVIGTSDKAIINYESFNVYTGEKVQFVQPSASSCVLNRIVGDAPSSILGQVSANGRVFFVNPRGVYFGPESKVDVGSLVVSTLDISDMDFLNENYRFVLGEGSGSSEILNKGRLTASHGGVALLAPSVINQGAIVARMDNVVIGSGKIVTLDFSGDGLFSFAVEGALEKACIENAGEIQAMQGQVLLHAKTARQLVRHLINMEGVELGAQIVKEGGVIRLVPKSRIEASRVEMAAGDIEVNGTVVAESDLEIRTSGVCKIRDSETMPLVFQAGGKMTIEGEVIDLLALSHPETCVFSGSDMTLVSPNEISADAHLRSGNFSLKKPDGSPGDFKSLYDPIVSVTGDASFGAYSGVALKVEATGNITATGAITITGADGTVVGGGTDGTLLQTTSALILRAGLSSLVGGGTAVPPNFISGGATFTSTGAATGAQISLGGAITTSSAAGQVILQGNVRLTSGVTITTGGGNVTVTTTGPTSSPLAFGTIDGLVAGSQALNITAGTGTISIEGAIGNTTSLSSLTLSGSSITVANIGGGGSGVTGATNITSTGNITLNGSSYNTTGLQNFTTAVGGTFVTSSASPITFSTSGTAISLLNGMLIPATATTNINFSSGIGAITMAGVNHTSIALSFTSTGIVTINGAINVGSVSFLATPSSTNINADFSTQNTGITFPGAVTLTSSTISSGGAAIAFNNTLTLNAGTLNISSGGGNITFTGSGGNSILGNSSTGLTVTAGAGTVNVLGVIGPASGTAVSNLTITAGLINIANIGAAANTGVLGQTILTSTTAINFTGSNYRGSGSQIFTAAAGSSGPTVGFHLQNAVLTSFLPASPCTFNAGTIFLDASPGLTINTGNASITVGDIKLGTSPGGFPVSLTAGVATLTVGNIGTTVADISTLTLSAITGTLRIEGNVFATTLTIGASPTTGFLGGNISTSSATALTFAYPLVVIAPDVRITPGVGANVVITGTINADLASNDRNLSITTTGAGIITLSGIIGGSQPLTSITAVSAGGTITVGAMTVKGTSSLPTILIPGAVYLSSPGGTIISNTAGNITTTGLGTTGSVSFFSTSLTLTGAKTIDTSAGGGNITMAATPALGTVTIAGLTAASAYTFNAGTGNVTIVGNLTGSTTGAVTLLGGNLLVGGITTTTGAINVGTVAIPATSITLNGTTYSSTSGVHTYAVTTGGAISLAGTPSPISFTTTAAGGAINFPNTPNMTLLNSIAALNFTTASATSPITVGRILGGNGSTVVTLDTGAAPAAITLGGLGTAAGQFGNLGVTANTLRGTTFRTTGDIYTPRIGLTQITSAITLGGSISTTDPAGITFPAGAANTVTQTSGTTISISSAGGPISFANTTGSSLTSGGAGTTTLSILGGAGTVSFSGVVGGVPFGSITVSSTTGITQSSVSAINATSLVSLTGPLSCGANISASSGSITVTGNVTLTAASQWTSGLNSTLTNGITETGNIDGAFALTLSSTLAPLSVTGTIGGTTALTSLAVTGRSITLGGTGATAYRTSGALGISFTALSGQAITFNGGGTVSVTSGGNPITFSGGTITLSSAPATDLTIGSATASTIEIGPVSGVGRTLTLTTTSTALNGIVLGGGSTGITVATLTLNTDVVSATNIQLNSNITTTTALTFPATGLGNTAVTGSSTITSTNTNVSFPNAVIGPMDLTVNSGTGTISFTGNVGSGTPLSALTLSSSNATTSAISYAGTIATAGPITVTASNPTGAFSSATNITTGGGNLTVNGRVFLTGTPVIWSAVTGDILITGTITGSASPRDFTLSTAGTVTFNGAVGTGVNTRDFTVIGSTITQGSTVNVTGTVSYNGTTINIGNDITTSLAAGTGINLAGGVVLVGSTTWTTANSSILISSTINSDLATNTRNLVMNAGTNSVTLSNTIGGLQPITSLAVTASTINLGTTITTNGVSGQVYTGPVVLTGATSLATSTGPVFFSSTITGGNTLAIGAGTGLVTFTGVVGGATPPTGVTVSSSSAINFTAATFTSDNQSFTSTGNFNVANGSPMTFTTAGGAGNILFSGGTLTQSGAIQNLTITTGSGSITTPNVGTALGQFGILTLNTTGAVTTAGNIFANSISFTGVPSLITIGGNITTNDTLITFPSAVTQTTGTTVNIASGGTVAGNGVTFSSSLNSGGAGTTNLTVNGGAGDLSFVGAIGTVPFGTFSATTTGVLTQGAAASINTTGAISLIGTTIDSRANITSSTGGLTMTGVITRSTTTATTWALGGGTTLITGAINSDATPRDLVITGASNITITGNIGNVNPMAQISITGNSVTLGATVITSTVGTQSYTAASGQLITFNAGSTVTLTSNGNQISFNGGTLTLTPGTNLTLNVGAAPIVIGPVNAPGDALVLNTTSAANPAIALTGPMTVGSISFPGPPVGPIQLNGSLTTTISGSPITFPTALTLAGNSQVTTTNADITFASTINGAASLGVSAGTGNIIFNGAIGGITPLTGLTVFSCTNLTFGSPTITANTMSFTASSQFIFPFSSGATTTFTGSGSGGIVFNTGIMRSTLGSPKNVSFLTGSGPISLSAVGALVDEFDTLTIGTTGPFSTTGPILIDPIVFTSIPSSITFGGSFTLTGTEDTFFIAQGNILNGSGAGLISSNGNLTFNSLQGDVGTLTSPISVQTPQNVFAGAYYLANFVGSTGSGTVEIVPSNPPCLLIFNNVVLRYCKIPTPPIPLSPLFFYTYVVGIYSNTDSLANNSYYELDFYQNNQLKFPADALYWELIPEEKKKVRKRNPVPLNKTAFVESVDETEVFVHVESSIEDKQEEEALRVERKIFDPFWEFEEGSESQSAQVEPAVIDAGHEEKELEESAITGDSVYEDEPMQITETEAPIEEERSEVLTLEETETALEAPGEESLTLEMDEVKPDIKEEAVTESEEMSDEQRRWSWTWGEEEESLSDNEVMSEEQKKWSWTWGSEEIDSETKE